MTVNRILHILRNPWGWDEEVVRMVRLEAADFIEHLVEENKTLHSRLAARDRSDYFGYGEEERW